jgi:hypothetical protein
LRGGAGSSISPFPPLFFRLAVVRRVAFFFTLAAFLPLVAARAGDFLAVDRLAVFFVVFFFTLFLVADAVLFPDPFFEAPAERADVVFFVVRFFAVFLDWVVRLATPLGPQSLNSPKFLFDNKKQHANSQASIWFFGPGVKILRQSWSTYRQITGRG